MRIKVWGVALALGVVLSAPVGWIGVSRADSMDPLAVAFGSLPSIWNVRISPDGSKFSFLGMHTTDRPFAAVYDSKTGETKMVLLSEEDRFDVRWCDWANEERLLCGYRAILTDARAAYPSTRLVAVNADRSKMKVLLQRKLADRFAQYQDGIIDWLPDDPKRVLIEMPDARGSGVVRLDIYSGGTRNVQRPRADTYGYVSDGHGEVRLRRTVKKDETRWYYRLAGDRNWRLLDTWDHEEPITDYIPLGFGANANELLVLEPKDGRMALWSEDLANERKKSLLFAHDHVDVGGTYRIGKERRVVAVGYSTDRSHLHFFDEAVARITDRLDALFPDLHVRVVDESWDRRFYLVFVSSDRDAGKYYRFDTQKNVLEALSSRNESLEGISLVAMEPIEYPARDGVPIPGYLTRPASEGKSLPPAVVLPHGGPHSRDYWGYDWLVQFLAARGYVVLQSNYRGSWGYGAEWAGLGGFRDRATVIRDIEDGARYLVEAGIADPDRLCIVGWSFGGYAALMSGIENPARYRCVVSIAGVTDLPDLIKERKNYLGSKAAEEFIGRDKAMLERGSPARRADELQAPVLLFHGDEDVNVSVDQSNKMAKRLRKANKDVTFVEYEEIDHGIYRNTERIDMLTRIGAFLDEHTRPRPADRAAGAEPGLNAKTP